MALAYIDRIDNLSMKESHGVISKLTRKCRVGGLVTNDYGALLEGLITAGVPLSGTPLVAPNLRRLHPFGMLVLVDRDVKILDDPGWADVVLDYEHFMNSDNQDMSQLSLDVPSWREDLPLGAAQGPPGSYIGWVSVFGKNRTSVQQTKTNFGYRNYATGVIADWAVLVGATVLDWDVVTNYADGDLARSNGAIYRATAAVVGGTPPPAVNWRLAIGGTDWPFGTYTAGTVVRYRGFFWYALVNTPGQLPPTPGANWRIARPGTDYPVAADSRERYLVTVGHRFPDSDPQVGGQTLYQTGEITVMDPHRNFTIQGTVMTAFPWRVANNVIGRINKFPWMDGPIDHWMCTEACWEAIFVRRKYKMKFEFQMNPDGWQPTAVFVDRRTGRPPPDLVPNFGYRTVDYHEEIDFNYYFQSNFEL